MHPINFEGIHPRKTKIEPALPSYKRQRLSDIRRGWCPPRPSKRGRKGDPFRRKRSSPPVLKWARSKGAGWPSQGETTGWSGPTKHLSGWRNQPPPPAPYTSIEKHGRRD